MCKTSWNILSAVTHPKKIAWTSCKINNTNVLLFTSSFHTRKTMDSGSLRNPSRLGMLSRFICVQSICLWWKIKFSLAKRRATRSMIFWIIVVEGFLSWCSNVCWMRYVDIKDCCTNQQVLFAWCTETRGTFYVLNLLIGHTTGEHESFKIY